MIIRPFQAALAAALVLALGACDKNPYDQAPPDTGVRQGANRDTSSAQGQAVDEAREPEQSRPERADLAPTGGAVPQEGPLPNENDRYATALSACRELQDPAVRQDCERQAEAQRQESRRTDAEGTGPATPLDGREGGDPIDQGRGQ